MSVRRTTATFTASDTGPLLSLQLITYGPPAVIRVSGDVDVCSAHLITDLVDHLAVFRPAPIILNLANVAFFDAAGVTALLRARASITAAGGGLFLHQPSIQVWRVLTLTGTDHLFQLDPSGQPHPVFPLLGYTGEF